MAQQDNLREDNSNSVIGWDNTKLPYLRFSQFDYPALKDEYGNDSNKYYLTNQARDSQGNQIGWNPSDWGSSFFPGDTQSFSTYSVLPNCVGYAFGRFAEIMGEAGLMISNDGIKTMRYTWIGGPSEDWIRSAENLGLETGTEPAPGAMIVFKGHAGIVEQVLDDDTIVCSESGYWGNRSKDANIWPIRKETRHRHGRGGAWLPGDWWTAQPSSEYFIGFIYNPSISYAVPTESSGVVSEAEADLMVQYPSTSYEDVQVEVTRNTLTSIEYDGELNRTQSANLLTVPTYVEAPFVTVKIGDYTLGTYNKKQGRIVYPNYVNRLTVKKTKNAVNEYTIEMIYQVRPGEDPNFIDKIFSTVSDTRRIFITYGDWNAPTFIYKEEEALITDVKTRIDFGTSRINYTVSAVSTSASVYGVVDTFPAVDAKPSDIIFKILYKENYGLLENFYGMRDEFKVRNANLIATNDQVVHIEEQRATDPLSYINYLVTCMISDEDTDNTNPIKSSSYFMTIEDNVMSDFGGPYFKVKEVKAGEGIKAIHDPDVYEVDVGFPGNTMVQSFNVNEDQLYSILYNYSTSIDTSNYSYNIDNEGNILTEFSPSLLTSTKKNKVTPTQKTWWTQMTRFPITATIVIKGLVRPAMLMTRLRVNSFFYGQRHTSSGLYVITGQEDTIDTNGYRTALSLLRVGGDEDYITKTTVIETRRYPVLVKTTVNNNYTDTTTIPEQNDGGDIPQLSEPKWGMGDILKLFAEIHEKGGLALFNGDTVWGMALKKLDYIAYTEMLNEVKSNRMTQAKFKEIMNSSNINYNYQMWKANKMIGEGGSVS